MSVEGNPDLMSQVGNKGVARLNELGELNLRTLEKLAGRQMDAMNLMMEQGVRQMKLATESKGYSEYLKGGVELATEISTRMMEESKINMQLVGQVRDDYRDWFQKGVSELSSDFRKAGPSA
jgi:hypothetical protein